jgi:F-type H+-transporting ATPase subunit a
MSNNPFHQFEIKPLLPIEVVGFDLSFTNSSLFMLLALALVSLLYFFVLKNPSIIPSRLQSIGEVLFEFISSLVTDFVGAEGRKYFPLIFSIFLFVLFGNLLGMIPYGFTITSHIIVTFGLGFSVFVIINIVGFMRHGFHFFSFFLPSGIPLVMAPMMVFIEIFTYLSRPISLSVRLAANMIAGHVLLKVLAGFVLMLGLVFGAIPIPFISVLVGFEIFVAILQAYIFTILICVYLNDAVNLH